MRSALLLAMALLLSLGLTSNAEAGLRWRHGGHRDRYEYRRDPRHRWDSNTETRSVRRWVTIERRQVLTEGGYRWKIWGYYQVEIWASRFAYDRDGRRRLIRKWLADRYNEEPMWR